MEAAKHRLFYSLIRLALPIDNRVDAKDHGLTFEFQASPIQGRGPKVLTGHDNGIITTGFRVRLSHARTRICDPPTGRAAQTLSYIGTCNPHARLRDAMR
jgi:hypothetical protein